MGHHTRRGWAVRWAHLLERLFYGRTLTVAERRKREQSDIRRYANNV